MQGFEEGDGGCWGEVFVVVVIDLDHGRVDAGAEALDFREGEELVGGCLAGVDAEVGGYCGHDAVGAASAELAWGLEDRGFSGGIFGRWPIVDS